jgi:HEPN superfamily RiboL-PSP-like protein
MPRGQVKRIRMPSEALGALTERLRDVDQLMKAHEAVGGLEPGRRYDVEGLNRAAVLMLCAHLEGYVEDLMTEALAALNTDLDPKPLLAHFHNPWPDRIDDLFGFIGMEAPCRGVSWQRAGNLSVRTNLGELVQTRNRIAHGVAVNVRKVDVTRYRRYVEGFTASFDRSVRSHVRGLTGQNPW